MEYLVLNTQLGKFTNDKTGEIINYSSTTIAKKGETTDNFVGYLVEEVTGKSQDFDVIKQYVGKTVAVDIEYKKVDKKNYRAKINKIANQAL